MNSTDNFKASTLRPELIPETAFIDYNKQIITTGSTNFQNGTIGFMVLSVAHNTIVEMITSNLTATAEIINQTVETISITGRGSKDEARDIKTGAGIQIPISKNILGVFIPCDLDNLTFNTGNQIKVLVIERTLRTFDV